MPIKVKAFVPEGDAVQVQITREPLAMCNRVAFHQNSPQWFVDLAMRNMQDGTLDCWNGLMVEDPKSMVVSFGHKPRRQIAYSGDWLIRSADGNVLCLPPETFDMIYDRVEQPQ